MRTPCAATLEVAKELLEFGVLSEGAQELVALHRCASAGGCEDWQACTCRIEQAWTAGASPAPPAAEVSRGADRRGYPGGAARAAGAGRPRRISSG